MTHRTLAAIAAATVAIVAGATAWTPQASAKADDAKVERGRYIVNAGMCHDCHTPLKMGPNGPERDYSRMLSGHPEGLEVPPPPAAQGPWNVSTTDTMTAWSGPWGVTYSANLTPDPETGLGGWTEKNFIDTIRNGRHQGKGRPILPPMPIEMLQNYTDEDLAAIYAYLQTVPAMNNRAPEPELR